MNKTSFIIITFVFVTKCNALPQFFSLGIGFGSDDSPLTFHTSDSSQEAAPSFQSQPFSFQSPQSAPQSQQSAPQSQQSPLRSQQSSFQSQQSSFQPEQSAFQSQQFQAQSSFQSSPATAAPPPARSAPAPPMFNKQAGPKVNSFRQSATQQRVFAAPTQPSVPSFQRNFSQEPQQQQQQSQNVNSVGSHQEALERNALHRQQLATVIEAHNKKTFSQFENQVQEAPVIRSEETNIVNEDNLTSTRRVKIPAKRPVEIDNFRGNPTPATKAPKFSTKALPESLREDIIEHLRLINSLDQQVNELVAKASRVFSTNENSGLSKRKQFKQERINKVNNSEEDELEIPQYETEVE